MNLNHILAFVHLLTFGIGFASCWARARALNKLKDPSGLKEVFLSDNFWGLAAALWIGTGLWRVFSTLEKGSEYYLHSTAFWIKMSLFLLVFILELKPMITLIQWRIRQRKGETIDLSSANTLAKISYAELALLIPILLMATAMARGVWF